MGKLPIARDDHPAEERGAKPPPLRLALTVIAAFIVFFGVYEALCALHVTWIVRLYGAILLAALLAFVIINGGFRREPLTAELLPDRWDEEKKRKYLASRPLRIRVSRILLIVIIPLLFTFAVDFVILRFFSGLY